MTKAKFERNKPHCNIGTIGHVDHGKTSLTAAITKILAKTGGATFTAYDQIDKAPEERERGITISTAHVEYETTEPPLRARRLPGPRRLREEHDHGRGADGRRDPGGVARPTARCRRRASTSCWPARSACRRWWCYMNKVDMVDDPELLDLVELEVRELLKSYQFPGDDIPVVRGSALMALEDKNAGAGRAVDPEADGRGRHATSRSRRATRTSRS